jgi:uncharacterized protein (DUF58 family)
MVRNPRAGGLTALDTRDLAALGRIADRLFAGRPGRRAGHVRRRHVPGQGAEFLDYQDYAAGTDIRALDWRASARLTRPVVRRRHDDSTAEWFVCLDRSASMAASGPAKWRCALHLAAAFLYILLRRGHAAGVVAFSGDVDAICPLGRGEAQLHRGLAFLDRLEPRRQGGGSRLACCAPVLGPRRSAIAISDFLFESGFTGDFDRLLTLGGEVQALRVVDANDVPPLSGEALTIRDAETGGSRAILAGDAARAAAAARFAALGTAVAEACARRGIPLTHCDSAAPWMTGAVAHLNRLTPGRA